MKPGEKFEKECYEYLKSKYASKTAKFIHKGGMNSTESDIGVIKNEKIDFYIEAKDTFAQSGQFVLIPQENIEKFKFSDKNNSKQNEMTDIIIKYMNNNFYKFNNAGTAGEEIKIDTSVFSRWIINHYKEKNVKYVISYDENYVILPIRKFDSYFEISAIYRIKKSGSGKPAKKDREAIKEVIKKNYPSAKFSIEEEKFLVNIENSLNLKDFKLGNYTYHFSKKLNNFEIRRLSNTYNRNVIFSIKLIKSQDINDLKEFENDL